MSLSIKNKKYDKKVYKNPTNAFKQVELMLKTFL